jgi:hypothetical protein
MTDNFEYVLNKKELETKVNDRIQKGYAIRQKFKTNPSENVVNEYDLWDSYNITMLKTSFSTPENRYYKRYLPYVSVAGGDRYRHCLSELDQRLKVLESIINEKDMIKEEGTSLVPLALALGAGGLIGYLLSNKDSSEEEIMAALKELPRRYQIFISSTDKDLKEERQAVIRAVLDEGHMPISMEQLSASSIQQVDLVKDLMSECDYVLFIIAGRYGTTIDAGNGRVLSYTELEYEYARSKGIQL